ncbi:MAG: LLM class flavin-dependent oxidoreductase, partial [Alphaproteobacteria bacterium]
VKGYEQFSKFFGNLKKMADPAQMDPWIDLQLCGTAKTAAKQLQRYIEIGFDSFIIQVATYGVPRALRHDLLSRFAQEVAPAFAPKFGA